ncbi:MAG: aspartate kinase [Alphaproteobacteria bacterium]
MKKLIVQKYGGTSVANPQRIKKVAERVARYRRRGYSLVVVVSALGDTTDDLIELAHQINEEPSEREMDMLMSTGEQISVALLAMAIHKLGFKAKSFTGAQVGIITDDAYTRAKIVRINARRIKKELEQGKIVIVAGFQGITLNRDITTLGRGGSDVTAVALAKSLGSCLCEIYTDVDGVFTADHQIVPGARKLPRLSYDEMLELASLGSQVLHSRSVEIAKKFNIPIHVRSSFNNRPGTKILREAEMMERFLVSGVTLNTTEAKITIQDVPDRPGIAAVIFKEIARHNINVDMIVQNISRTGYTDVSFTVLKADLKKTLKVSHQISKKIGAGSVTADSDIARISVVGVGMKSHSGAAAKMFEALAASRVNIEMISTSEISISCVVRKRFAKKALRAVHKKFGLDKKIFKRRK